MEAVFSLKTKCFIDQYSETAASGGKVPAISSPFKVKAKLLMH